MAHDPPSPEQDPDEEEWTEEDLLSSFQYQVILRVLGMGCVALGVFLHVFIASRDVSPGEYPAWRYTNTARFTAPMCILFGLGLSIVGSWANRWLFRGSGLSPFGWVVFFLYLLACGIFRMFVYAD